MNMRREFSSAFQDELPNFVSSGSKTSSLPINGPRVRVTHPASRWLVELRSRFDELTSLPHGWDGYAGRPVSFTCAQFAANLIERLYVAGVPAPQLVPGGDGTVQIEWHRNHFDVEIDVLGPYEVVAVRKDLRTGQAQEVELQTDFTPLSDWIVQLEGASVFPMRVRA